MTRRRETLAKLHRRTNSPRMDNPDGLMHEISFVIPLRIDSPDRLENADTSIAYLKHHFPRSRVVVVEHAKEPSLRERWHGETIIYCFMQSDGPFCRGGAINEGVIRASTEFVCVYDADVMIAPQAMREAVALMRRRKIKALLPHNTLFLNVAGESRARLIKALSLDSVPVAKSLKTSLPGSDYTAYPIPSGVVLFERKTLIACGGFNKKMMGYGWEDIEVLKRLNKLGFHYHILGRFNVVHLDHSRGFGAKPDAFHYEKNKAEFLSMVAMSRRRLVEYVDSDLKIDSTVSLEHLDRMVLKRRWFNLVHLGPLTYFFGKAFNFARIKGFGDLLLRPATKG